MALINCKECGKEISDKAELCPHCGYKEPHDNVAQQSTDIFQQQNQPETVGQAQNVPQEAQSMFQNVTQPQFYQPIAYDKPNKKNLLKNKSFLLAIVIVIISLVVGIFAAKILFDKYSSSKAIRVDISMTNFYGHIDYILDEFDLDFDLVTMGANCYTGVQKNQFRTEKYGILHTEFRYCAANDTLIFRVYNDEKDQPLRDPRPGELAQFNQYGEKISSGSSSL